MSRSIALLLMSLCLISCKTQVKLKEFKYPEVGWRVAVPNDFTMGNPERQRAFRNWKYLSPNYKTDSLLAAASKTQGLLVISKGFENELTSSVTPCNVEEYQLSTREFQKMHAMGLEDPDLNLDTTMYSEVIDGVKFDVIHSKISNPLQKSNTKTYNAFRRGYRFTIWVHYDEEIIGRQLTGIVSSSKFI